MNSTLRALNGFGLGARPGEPPRIDDPRGWLRAQLQGEAPILRAPAEGSSSADCRCHSGVPHDRPSRRSGATCARQQARRVLVGIAGAESGAALTERVTTDQSFVERLVAFWSS